VKVKLIDIYNSVPVMNKILETPMSASLAFQLNKLLKVLNDEMKSIEEERVKLVEKYGSKDDNSDAVVVSDENKNKFMSEFSELLGTDVTISWEPLSISKVDGLQLTVNEMSRIQFLFKE
jgi:vacuolar-type H+-ATPase subunit I/STV1